MTREEREIFYGLAAIVGAIAVIQLLRARQGGVFYTPGQTPQFPAEQPQGLLSSPALKAIVPMTISKNGLYFLINEEGFTANPKRDTHGHMTIGYGHTIQPGDNLSPPIDEAKAEALLLNDLRASDGVVNRAVTVPLSQDQFDALVSFEYNVGAQAFRTSTLLRKLNASDYAGASQEFSRWIYSEGKVNNGLVGRRSREQQLFNGAGGASS